MIVNDYELDKFLKAQFNPKNINRIKTFEKYAFNSLEKGDTILVDNLNKIRGTDPKSTCGVIDLWAERDKLLLQKMTNFEEDKESLKQYFYIKGIQLRKKNIRKMKIKKLKSMKERRIQTEPAHQLTSKRYQNIWIDSKNKRVKFNLNKTPHKQFKKIDFSERKPKIENSSSKFSITSISPNMNMGSYGLKCLGIFTIN